MTERIVSQGKTRPAGEGEPIMIDTADAREWALNGGIAKIVDGELQTLQGTGTLGRAVVRVANSEQQTEDLGAAYRSIARTREEHTPVLTLSDEALASIVHEREVSMVLQPINAG